MNIFHTYPIIVPIAAGLAVEAGKLIIAFSQKRSISLHDVLQTGGMPSGHSAFVTALAVTMFILYGPQSPVFTLAGSFAVLVMYDALKLRRAAGLHAAAINLLLREKRYNERLGHTPLEVLAGIAVGLLVPPILLFSF